MRWPGGTYFFTVAMAPLAGVSLLDTLHVLRDAYGKTLSEQPFVTDAIVVLPDHLHAVWSLPPGDSDYSLRWSKIKRRYARALGSRGPRSPSKIAKREAGIWQRRFWEHTIRNPADYELHVAYCWSDPVRHGYCARAQDWDASSFHREVRAGKVSEDWTAPLDLGRFGERGESERHAVALHA